MIGFDAAMIGFDVESNGFDAGSDGSDIAIGDSIFSSEGIRPEVEVTENGIARKPRQFSSLPLLV
jgi:hypothetical protein